MEFVYGRWPVLECLRANRRKFEHLLLADRVNERDEKLARIQAEAQRLAIPVQRVPRRVLDDLTDGQPKGEMEGHHQGVVLRVSSYPYVDIEDIVERAAERQERPFLLLLDHLKDPQNVGTLIRVADAVGVHGVVIQKDRAVGVTPAVVRASAGAVEHLYLAQVTNLVQTMKELKKQDIWLVGMDTGENIPVFDPSQLNMAVGLVMGSEGEGISRLVRETCDLLMTLPQRGNVGSLNVSTAGAVALYGAWQARGYGK
jgi:23S rRNA (guanosine2251-2'-O)-methyltransferase